MNKKFYYCIFVFIAFVACNKGGNQGEKDLPVQDKEVSMVSDSTSGQQDRSDSIKMPEETILSNSASNGFDSKTTGATVTNPVENQKGRDGDLKVYGAWNMIGAVVMIYEENGNCYVIKRYNESKYGEPELYYKKSYQGQTAFVNAKDSDDMYVINRNGDLDGYNAGEKVISLQSISN